MAAPSHELADAVTASMHEHTPIAGRRRTVMLALLTFIYALNYLDRQIVVILQEPIKHEFGLQDWQLGLLTGVSISLFYTAMGIPIARWVDRGLHRVRLIAAITALWSLMTALCGLTRNYGQFIVARMGVGLAEAGFGPASHSLLSDLYPLHRRPAAMGIFAVGIPIGIMGGLSIGGVIAQYYDWRTALLVAGLPGVLIALAFYLFAREPARGASEEHPIDTGAPSIGFVDAVKTLLARRAYVHVVLGSAATSFAATAVSSWLPSFLIRVHEMSLSHAGLGVGLLAGGAGFIGTTFGGWQASRLSRHGLHAMLWIPIAGLLIAIPLFVIALIHGNGVSTLWLLFPPMVLVGFWTAPSIALTQSLAPVSTRATSSAILIVMSNLVGVALGPIVAGLLSDGFTSITGDAGEGLQWALVCSSLLFFWGIAHWGLAVRALRLEPRAA